VSAPEAETEAVANDREGAELPLDKGTGLTMLAEPGSANALCREVGTLQNTTSRIATRAAKKNPNLKIERR
jgi:hypothetical protein